VSDHSEIIRALPDVHRWVEARALLLTGSCDVFGVRTAPDVSVIVRADPSVHTLESCVLRIAGRRGVEAGTQSPPSWRLAVKLGFEPIDELAFSQRPGQ